MLNKFFELSEKAIEFTSVDYVRPQIALLKQEERLIGIKGSRGVGKTTLLMQFAKMDLNGVNKLYISLDNPYFSKNNLIDFVDIFVKNGGEYLLLDEVHHYNDWSFTLKTIYDNYKSLRIIYTGSSLLHLMKGRADLSRRAVIYTLHGLSLREYINLNTELDFQPVALDDILHNHVKIAREITRSIRPIQHYNDYINTGYYPFFLENRETYHLKLIEIVNQILESDLPIIANVNYANIHKLKQLLQIIAESVPFKPNIEKLCGMIGVSKNTLKEYMYYLQEAMLVSLLRSDKLASASLAKPDKIYLQHPNLMFCIANENSNQGNLRECFFLNQMQAKHKVNYSEIGDFIVNRKIIFEIGGKNKSYRQIADIKNSYVAADDIEIGFKNTIPLWLFGFLY